MVLNDIGIGLYNAQGNYMDNNIVSLGNGGISLFDSTENMLSNNLIMTGPKGIGLNNSTNNTLINNTASSSAMDLSLESLEEIPLHITPSRKTILEFRARLHSANTLINNSLYLNGVGVGL